MTVIFEGQSSGGERGDSGGSSVYVPLLNTSEFI